MLFASMAETTASMGTLVNRLIFALKSGGMGRSVRQSRTSGWIPMVRSSLTLCWVGLVFSSPEVEIWGTSVRWTKTVLAGPRARRIWRMASRNGWPSMSPTVPPISTMTTSIPSVTDVMAALISSVTWGMTWTVLPRYSPFRSFRRMDS